MKGFKNGFESKMITMRILLYEVNHCTSITNSSFAPIRHYVNSTSLQITEFRLRGRDLIQYVMSQLSWNVIRDKANSDNRLF